MRVICVSGCGMRVSAAAYMRKSGWWGVDRICVSLCHQLSMQAKHLSCLKPDFIFTKYYCEGNILLFDGA